MNSLTFPFSDDRIPPNEPGSKEMSRFIELNINAAAIMATVTVSITSNGDGTIPNPLPQRGVLTFVPATNAFEEEVDYLITVWCRGDVMTQAEAAAQVGVSVQTISSGVKRRQIRGFVNPDATNPRRGAILVSLAEVRDQWGKR